VRINHNHVSQDTRKGYPYYIRAFVRVVNERGHDGEAGADYIIIVCPCDSLPDCQLAVGLRGGVSPDGAVDGIACL